MKFEFLSIRIFKNNICKYFICLIKINLENLWNLFDRISISSSSIQRFNDQNETLILLSV